MSNPARTARAKSEQIRQFIIAQVAGFPTGIAKRTAAHFGISRQAVHRHLQRLVADGILTEEGATRGKEYQLCTLDQWQKSYLLFQPQAQPQALAESEVWGGDIESRLARLSKNAVDIWHYCCTEMFNNAIEHSGGDRITVAIEKNAARTKIHILDDGIGIFKKIQQRMGLSDERHASLELAKGKFTTDPENHSGEGVFFTSHMLDEFWISSGRIFFSHAPGEPENWMMEPRTPQPGTAVMMQLDNATNRTSRETFTQFAATADDYEFNKTVIPVRLAQYGDDALVSRSQAKRLLVRLDLFATVILDFTAVESLGQAFADEIFRVFAKRHPQIKLHAINQNAAVEHMIRRAQAHR